MTWIQLLLVIAAIMIYAEKMVKERFTITAEPSPGRNRKRLTRYGWLYFSIVSVLCVAGAAAVWQQMIQSQTNKNRHSELITKAETALVMSGLAAQRATIASASASAAAQAARMAASESKTAKEESQLAANAARDSRNESQKTKEAADSAVTASGHAATNAANAAHYANSAAVAALGAKDAALASKIAADLAASAANTASDSADRAVKGIELFRKEDLTGILTLPTNEVNHWGSPIFDGPFTVIGTIEQGEKNSSVQGSVREDSATPATFSGTLVKIPRPTQSKVEYVLHAELLASKKYKYLSDLNDITVRIRVYNAPMLDSGKAHIHLFLRGVQAVSTDGGSDYAVVDANTKTAMLRFRYP